MASHMPGGKPGSVTTDIGSLDMTKRNRDLAKRAGALTAGSGHATRLAAGDPCAQRRHSSPDGPGAPGLPHGARAAGPQGCRMHDKSCKRVPRDD